MGAGITILSIETEEEILHIPTCASSLHGLLSLNNQALAVSQAHKHGSPGGGALFIWALNKVLFASSADGRIFANMLDLGLTKDPFVVAEDQSTSHVLNGHNFPSVIVAFDVMLPRIKLETFFHWTSLSNEEISSKLYGIILQLVNAGKTANLVVIPQSSLLSARNHHKMSPHFHVTCLEKYPELDESSMGMITLPLSHCPLNNDSTAASQSTLSTPDY
ncbi:hypothetical protein RJ641_014222 [Dillenia turbinata]|uniref:Uncharacterized protein n=1 Tax=Dillenia turbinata TaxID=194707 RepID=A0AAN8UTX0_9MAGN